jgi:excisionase family DNA binding protein
MELLSVPDVADSLGVPVTKVRQMIRDHKLLAVRTNGVLQVPADFVFGGTVLKGLPGLLTVLADQGYDEQESLRWLYEDDPSLPGTPVQALRDDRHTEVTRRAQALAL